MTYFWIKNLPDNKLVVLNQVSWKEPTRHFSTLFTISRPNLDQISTRSADLDQISTKSRPDQQISTKSRPNLDQISKLSLKPWYYNLDQISTNLRPNFEQNLDQSRLNQDTLNQQRNYDIFLDLWLF